MLQGKNASNNSIILRHFKDKDDDHEKFALYTYV